MMMMMLMLFFLAMSRDGIYLTMTLKRLRRQRAVLALLWLSALALTLYLFSDVFTITEGTNEKKLFSAALVATLASPVFAITDRKLVCGNYQ